jgi:hypothetical protein
MCIVSTLSLTRFDPACNLSLFLFDFFWHSLDLITRRKQSYLWQNFILIIMSQYGLVSSSLQLDSTIAIESAFEDIESEYATRVRC